MLAQVASQVAQKLNGLNNRDLVSDDPGGLVQDQGVHRMDSSVASEERTHSSFFSWLVNVRLHAHFSKSSSARFPIWISFESNSSHLDQHPP